MDAVLGEFLATVERRCEPRGLTDQERRDGVLDCTPLMLRSGSRRRCINWRNIERMEACVGTLVGAGLDYVAMLNFFVYNRENELVAPLPARYFV